MNNHVRWNNFQAWLSNAKKQMVTRWEFSVIGYTVSGFGLKNKSLVVGCAARALGAKARAARPTSVYLSTFVILHEKSAFQGKNPVINPLSIG